MKGARKTKVMYGSNLSYEQLETYLKLLRENDLIRIEGREEIIYMLTEKGLRFLNSYEQIEDLINPRPELVVN